MERPDHDFRHAWHVAINRFNDARTDRGDDWCHFLYAAKDAADEVPRLAMLFKMERDKKLPAVLKRCSLSKPEPIPENHLTCCLGTKCAECKYLAAIEGAEITDEQKDTAKAWTCVTHAIGKGRNVDTSEGVVMTVGDRMYWNGVYESLATTTEEPSDA